jgi:hypothetical protein
LAPIFVQEVQVLESRIMRTVRYVPSATRLQGHHHPIQISALGEFLDKTDSEMMEVIRKLGTNLLCSVGLMEAPRIMPGEIRHFVDQKATTCENFVSHLTSDSLLVGQLPVSLCPDVEPVLGFMTRFLIKSLESYSLDCPGHRLWRDEGSVCWHFKSYTKNDMKVLFCPMLPVIQESISARLSSFVSLPFLYE